MLDYNVMCKWSQDFKVIENRVSIVNQIHGCRYDFDVSNPCALAYSHGRYSVTYDGLEVCGFGVYDADGIASALLSLTAWTDCLWRVRRAGFLRTV